MGKEPWQRGGGQAERGRGAGRGHLRRHIRERTHLLPAEVLVLEGQLDLEALDVDDDEEDEDRRGEVRQVREALAEERLLERLELVGAREEHVEERDDSALELRALAEVERRRREAAPEDGLADVRRDEEVDAAAEAVALGEQVVHREDHDARKEELADEEEGRRCPEVARVAVHAREHVRDCKRARGGGRGEVGGASRQQRGTWGAAACLVPEEPMVMRMPRSFDAELKSWRSSFSDWSMSMILALQRGEAVTSDQDRRPLYPPHTHTPPPPSPPSPQHRHSLRPSAVHAPRKQLHDHARRDDGRDTELHERATARRDDHADEVKRVVRLGRVQAVERHLGAHEVHEEHDGRVEELVHEGHLLKGQHGVSGQRPERAPPTEMNQP